MRTKEADKERKRLLRQRMTLEEKQAETIKRRLRYQKTHSVKVVEKVETHETHKKAEKQADKVVMGLKLKKKKRTYTLKQFSKKRYFTIDSEGYTDDKGFSHLNLIAIYTKFDNGVEYYRTYTDVDNMVTFQILKWISECYDEMKENIAGDLEGIIFGGDYDFTLWLKSLTREEALNVLNHVDPDGSDDFMVPVDFNKIRIGYVPSKFLTFQVGKMKKIFVSDIFGLTKLSFVNSLKFLKIDVPQAELDRMAHEKTLRGNFDKILTQEVIDYNKKELIYLHQMVNEIHKSLFEISWYPKQMYGVGAIGDYLLGLHNINEQEPYTVIEQSFKEAKYWQELINALEDSYFGGYIYPFIVGTVKGVSIYHYDLHSAYPSYMTQLPALKNGRWYRIEKPTWNQIDTASIVSIVKVKFDIPKDYPILPVRIFNGGVKYPSSGEWVYNVNIVKACHESNEVNLTPLILWEFIPENDKRPFDYINEIGDMKKATDKHIFPVKYNMLKLGMNNEYGKEIQVLGGSSDTIPTFYNIVYASTITGMTRAKLIRGITSVGFDNALLAMTDSIFSLKPLPAALIGEELGEFGDESTDEGRITDMTIIQSGFYFYHTDTGVIEYKHRGTEIALHGMTMKEISENYKTDTETTIQGILKWLKSPIRPHRLPVRSRFNKIPQAATPEGFKKIGSWSKIKGENDNLKNISFTDLFKEHGIQKELLNYFDLSKQYITIRAISEKEALKDIQLHKGTHAVLWNEKFQSNIEEFKLQEIEQAKTEREADKELDYLEFNDL